MLNSILTCNLEVIFQKVFFYFLWLSSTFLSHSLIQTPVLFNLKSNAVTIKGFIRSKQRKPSSDSPGTHLGVSSLSFWDGAVKCGSGCKSLCQALIDSAQLLWEDSDVVLQPLLLLFLLPDLMVQLIPLGVQVLNTWWAQTGSLYLSLTEVVWAVTLQG